jgi:hypothetical protein
MVPWLAVLMILGTQKTKLPEVGLQRDQEFLQVGE